MSDAVGTKEPVNAPEFRSNFVDVNNMPWEPLERLKGERKVLFEDKVTGMATIMFRVPPGTVIPIHEHPELEQTYVLEGSMVDHEGEVTAGNFVWRPGGSKHIARCPNGATFIAFFMKPSKRL
jgi:anti-sigma factor ChrR (cupin superfamily)